MARSGNNELVDALRAWAGVFMHQSMRRTIQFAKQHHLSMSQLGAMMHVRRAGSCAVADISDGLGVTSAAVSQMLDRLVDQGLVARTEDPSDRRAKRIELTPSGTDTLDSAMAAREAWFHELAASLDRAESSRAAAALTTLTERTRQLEVSQ
jgi:DNA-binding MarR family transcriptional regulator